MARAARLTALRLPRRPARGCRLAAQRPDPDRAQELHAAPVRPAGRPAGTGGRLAPSAAVGAPRAVPRNGSHTARLRPRHRASALPSLTSRNLAGARGRRLAGRAVRLAAGFTRPATNPATAGRTRHRPRVLSPAP